MKAKFAAILNSLPPQQSRSRLEPYDALIREMRKRRRSYREIAEVLREHFGLHIATSTICEFALSRAKDVTAKRDVKSDDLAATRNTKAFNGTVEPRRARASAFSPRKIMEGIAGTPQNALQDSSRKLKNKPRFEYNPEEPLRIQRK